MVDDGSQDATAVVARAHGAHVVSLPFNLGIGGAVQTGYRFARDNDFGLAVQVDGDGQHDPRDLPALIAPLLANEADLTVGSRFAGTGNYRPPLRAPARDRALRPHDLEDHAARRSPTRPRASAPRTRAPSPSSPTTTRTTTPRSRRP